MPELFLAALALVFLVLLLQKLEHAETQLLVKTLKWTLGSVIVLAAFYLILVGRLLHVAALVVLLILLLKQDVHKWVKAKSYPRSLPRPLSVKEAAALLNIKMNASVEEIEEAFKKASAKDSTEKARLEQARDILLKRKK